MFEQREYLHCATSQCILTWTNSVVNPAWIRTPLIEPLLAKPGFKDPVLEPEDVVSEIVKQVVSGKSGQLILPGSMYFLSSLRSWPSWLQYSIRNFIAHSLEDPDNNFPEASKRI
jgi:all-trans-retinol dehydrogenase (NAD+)